jgi:hypothetical protein
MSDIDELLARLNVGVCGLGNTQESAISEANSLMDEAADTIRALRSRVFQLEDKVAESTWSGSVD